MGAGAEVRLTTIVDRITSRSARRSICLYTPSVDPSGMGVQMLELAAELSAHADVSVLCWPTRGGQRVLEGAANLGVTSLGLPHPRDPSFGDAIVAFLEEHPADVFHSHVAPARTGAVRAPRSGRGSP